MIKLNEIANLPIQEIKKYYRQYINIGTPKILNMLGFDKLEPEYAEGMFIYTKDKRKIYDFTGGISVLNLGHNHPRILAARSKFNESKHMEVWKLFLSPY
jgi:putrescine aminotransferase